MNPIKFIDNLSLSSDGKLVSAGSNGRKAEIFMRQGDLDTACAVYSLMMMLVINKRVNRKDLTAKDVKPGYSSVRRLQNQFLGSLSGLYQNGYFFEDLAKELCKSFKKVATAETFTTNKEIAKDEQCLIKKDEFHQKIRETIDAGLPVQIGFSRKGNNGGHSIVAVGYQVLKTESNYLRIFCLDSGYELSRQSFWNTILDIDLDIDNKKTYQDYNYSDNCICDVDEILIIKQS